MAKKKSKPKKYPSLTIRLPLGTNSQVIRKALALRAKKEGFIAITTKEGSIGEMLVAVATGKAIIKKYEQANFLDL